MRKYLFLLPFVLFITSCDWKPEPIEVIPYDSFRKIDIVVGIKTIIEVEGNDFTVDSSVDTSIVEIISNDSGRIEIIGRVPGQTKLSYNYYISSELEGENDLAARMVLIFEVTNGFPLRVNVEDSVKVNLDAFVDSIQRVSHDSVDIRFSSGLVSAHNTVTYDMDSLELVVHGDTPGREGLIVTFFQQSDTLGEPLIFDIATRIHKVVLAEFYTNTGCVNCPEANHYLDNISAEFIDDFTLVRYHVNWTDPFDPMNLYNPGDVESRRAYYNIFAAPGFVLEGTLITSLDEDDWSGRVFNASQGLTPVYIGPIDVLESVDSLHLEFELNSFSSSLTDITIWSLVMEDSIEYAGSNGETLHMDVMRDMTSNPISVLIGLSTIQHSLKKPDDYGTAGPMNLLVFVQADSDKSVLQSRKQNLY
ncbi:MAG: hypothetical protein H8E26_15280 [FCB group bacterium]|nr:hypothetical protein [FCB group bacterium]MBL7027100.1 hypothetical protein [Candidatus Neomarinimicrobiota bacterium]MBL7122414.1 hypothetical protein [Candidatus Neomarinimicrobiota bacterium]